MRRFAEQVFDGFAKVLGVFLGLLIAVPCLYYYWKYLTGQ